MYASLHCTDDDKTRFAAEWVRTHGSELVGSQDYFAVRIQTDKGEVTLFLSPKQVDDMADRLRAAAYDRDVVLAEDSFKVLPVEIGGGG